MQLDAARAAASDAGPLDNLLNDPIARGVRRPVTAACKPRGLTRSVELDERIAGAVVLLREIKARDAEALSPANRISTTRSVAELVASMDEEALRDLLHRGQPDA